MENLIVIARTKQEYFELQAEYETWKAEQPKLLPSTRVKEPAPDEIFMTQKETARYLRVSIPCLIKMKKTGRIPYYQTGRTILYKKSEVLMALKKK